MAAEPSGPGIPPESGNFRQTGARKLEARPDADCHEESRFAGSSSDEKDSVAHLMEPVTKGKTRQYDGVNPPGSFGREDDPKQDSAAESDAGSASAEQARRPL